MNRWTHYAAPDGPPCRCAWCRANPPAIDPRILHMQKLQAGYREWRNRLHAERKRIERAEQERRRLEAVALADWLAQDVH